MGIIGTLFRGASRIVKVLPDFLLGTSAEAAGAGMRAAKGSIFTKAKAGFRALESDVAKQAAKDGNFFVRTGKNLFKTPSAIKNSAKAGARLAKMTGKSASAGALKGGFKAVAKKMPFIGAALTVLFEAPNIYKAFKEGGFKAGMKEIGGAGVELGCMAGGAAIGSAICPGIGTVVGGLIGGIAGMFVRGKTYSEKQAEAKTEGQGAVQYTDDEIAKLRQYGLSDEEIAYGMQNGYTVADIETLLAQQAQGVQQPTGTAAQQSTGSTDVQTQIAELERQNEQLRKELASAQGSSQTTGYTSPNPYLMSMYNPYAGTQNTYTNDILYQQLFGTTTPSQTSTAQSQQQQYPQYKFGVA